VLCARESRWHKAEQAFEAAVSLAQNMSYPHAQARALYEFGVMQTRMGETRCAHDRLDEALAIFQRLGADRDAERIRTVLVGTGA
jgi:uncharacterized protein HemY